MTSRRACASGPYEILAPICEGGMGEVYLRLLQALREAGDTGPIFRNPLPT